MNDPRPTSSTAGPSAPGLPYYGKRGAEARPRKLYAGPAKPVDGRGEDWQELDVRSGRMSGEAPMVVSSAPAAVARGKRDEARQLARSRSNPNLSIQRSINRPPTPQASSSNPSAVPPRNSSAGPSGSGAPPTGPAPRNSSAGPSRPPSTGPARNSSAGPSRPPPTGPAADRRPPPTGPRAPPSRSNTSSPAPPRRVDPYAARAVAQPHREPTPQYGRRAPPAEQGASASTPGGQEEKEYVDLTRSPPPASRPLYDRSSASIPRARVAPTAPKAPQAAGVSISLSHLRKSDPIASTSAIPKPNEKVDEPQMDSGRAVVERYSPSAPVQVRAASPAGEEVEREDSMQDMEVPPAASPAGPSGAGDDAGEEPMDIAPPNVAVQGQEGDSDPEAGPGKATGREKEKEEGYWQMEEKGDGEEDELEEEEEDLEQEQGAVYFKMTTRCHKQTPNYKENRKEFSAIERENLANKSRRVHRMLWRDDGLCLEWKLDRFAGRYTEHWPTSPPPTGMALKRFFAAVKAKVLAVDPARRIEKMTSTGGGLCVKWTRPREAEGTMEIEDGEVEVVQPVVEVPDEVARIPELAVTPIEVPAVQEQPDASLLDEADGDIEMAPLEEEVPEPEMEVLEQPEREEEERMEFVEPPTFKREFANEEEEIDELMEEDEVAPADIPEPPAQAPPRRRAPLALSETPPRQPIPPSTQAAATSEASDDSGEDAAPGPRLSAAQKGKGRAADVGSNKRDRSVGTDEEVEEGGAAKKQRKEGRGLLRIADWVNLFLHTWAEKDHQSILSIWGTSINLRLSRSKTKLVEKITTQKALVKHIQALPTMKYQKVLKNSKMLVLHSEKTSGCLPNGEPITEYDVEITHARYRDETTGAVEQFSRRFILRSSDRTSGLLKQFTIVSDLLTWEGKTKSKLLKLLDWPTYRTFLLNKHTDLGLTVDGDDDEDTEEGSTIMIPTNPTSSRAPVAASSPKEDSDDSDSELSEPLRIRAARTVTPRRQNAMAMADSSSEGGSSDSSDEEGQAAPRASRPAPGRVRSSPYPNAQRIPNIPARDRPESSLRATHTFPSNTAIHKQLQDLVIQQEKLVKHATDLADGHLNAKSKAMRDVYLQRINQADEELAKLETEIERVQGLLDADSPAGAIEVESGTSSDESEDSESSTVASLPPARPTRAKQFIILGDKTQETLFPTEIKRYLLPRPGASGDYATFTHRGRIRLSHPSRTAYIERSANFQPGVLAQDACWTDDTHLTMVISNSAIAVGHRTQVYDVKFDPARRGEPLAFRALPNRPHGVVRDGRTLEVASIASIASDGEKRLFATGGSDHTVQLWNISSSSSNESISVRRLHRGHRSIVSTIQYLPDRNLLVSGGGTLLIAYDCHPSAQIVKFIMKADSQLSQLHRMTCSAALPTHLLAYEMIHPSEQFRVVDFRTRPQDPVLKFGYDSLAGRSISRPSKFTRGSVCGVKFVKGGDDGVVRLWDLRYLKGEGGGGGGGGCQEWRNGGGGGAGGEAVKHTVMLDDTILTLSDSRVVKQDYRLVGG